VVIYLQCIVSQWASWKAGGAHLGSCPIAIAFIIIAEAVHHFHVIVVNWRFRVRVFVFVCLRAVDEGHLWGW